MGTSDTTLTGVNVLQMFWNANATQSPNTRWLRSANSAVSNTAFCVQGFYGVLGHSNVNSSNCARPAFQIDLSKVEYTIK